MRPDPVNGKPSNPQSFNLYAYVRNNPVNLTDPTGLTVSLGNDWEKAKKQYDIAKKAAGGGAVYLHMAGDEKSGYTLVTSNAQGLAEGGNVGKALNEWIGSKLTLNISIGQDALTNKGGGAYTEVNKGQGATIHLDPQAVEGATIGGVKQTVGSAMTHELGHSLYALHPGLLAASEAGKYGHVDPMGYLLRQDPAKAEGFPIAFENSTRPADQQRPYWVQRGDYDPPAAMPSPLW